MTVALKSRDGRTICERCRVAETPLARLKGLLGKSELPRGEGLLLRPASAVHTWFMRFPIDVVFVDRDLVVVGVAPDLKPWRAAGPRGAGAVGDLFAPECEP